MLKLCSLHYSALTGTQEAIIKQQNERMLLSIVKATGGTALSAAGALAAMSTAVKVVQPRLTSVNLRIGSALSIPCGYLGKVLKQSVPSLKKQCESYNPDEPGTDKVEISRCYMNPGTLCILLTAYSYSCSVAHSTGYSCLWQCYCVVASAHWRKHVCAASHCLIGVCLIVLVLQCVPCMRTTDSTMYTYGYTATATLLTTAACRRH